MRSITEKDLAYDSISQEWSEFVDRYDTERRIQVLIDDFLKDKIKSKSCLDAGCGLGFFTRALWEHHPTSVTAVDISDTLVAKLSHELPNTTVTAGDLLVLDEILAQQFDVVVSSEVIEHTPDPQKAVAQLAKSVKPGGYLSISCPNRRWIWLLRLAQVIRFRKNYRGYENWVYPSELVQWLQQSGMTIEKKRGIHLLPWQLLPKRLMTWLDEVMRQFSFPLSVNLAVLARKPDHRIG